VVECIVCFDEMTLGPDESDAGPPTTNCNHERNVCDQCLKMTYETAIWAGQVADLVCPDPECRGVVPMQSIRPKVSKDRFKALDSQMLRQAVSTMI
jgi:hypothetical protein